jgi:hypothetical protein
MTDQVDIDDYIAALQSHRLRDPLRVPRAYQESPWPLLRAYNGFTGIERRRGGQLIGWLQTAGCLPRPSRCDICDTRTKVAFHSESYYHVLRPASLCNACHMALHKRHFAWSAWRKIVDAYAVTGREWWALAPRYGIDIAEHLRARHRWGAADITRSPIAALPDAIIAQLPGNMLAHPML